MDTSYTSIITFIEKMAVNFGILRINDVSKSCSFEFSFYFPKFLIDLCFGRVY